MAGKRKTKEPDWNELIYGPREARVKALKDDLTHIYACLSMSIRTGGYGTKKHMDMYAQFKRMLDRIQEAK